MKLFVHLNHRSKLMSFSFNQPKWLSVDTIEINVSDDNFEFSLNTATDEIGATVNNVDLELKNSTVIITKHKSITDLVYEFIIYGLSAWQLADIINYIWSLYA